MFRYLLLIAVLLTPSFALAQEEQPITWGGYTLKPTLLMQGSYNDNLRAEDANEAGDFVTTIAPALSISKSIRDHEFTLKADGEMTRHKDESDEDTTNYKLRFDGLLTALRSLKIPFFASYKQDHRQRYQERTATTSVEPIEYNETRMGAGVAYQPNRAFVKAYGRYQQRRFDNGRNNAGGIVVRKDGDFDQIEAEIRVGYDSPLGYAPFLGLSYAVTDYERGTFNGTDFSGAKRDNDAVQAVAGMGFDYKGLVVGEVAIGQSWQRYDDAGIDDISALALRGEITWKPRERLALSVVASRKAEEDNFINQGLVETALALGAEYEIAHELFMNAALGYEFDDFESSNREDDIYSGSLGLVYKINRRFALETSYQMRSRQSNQAAAEYDQNIFRIGLKSSL